ncbi:DUF2493 domain-containing protein [Methanospirillum sp.]|nr:DUF2493 domain-containing protein [Methanospirillum sp.]HPP76739.1 DUF2493 domain-containing protein [Methanospirillum sp.]
MMTRGTQVKSESMNRLIVSGLRTCDRKDIVSAEISRYILEIGGVDEIVSGGSEGVDRFAKEYALEQGIPYVEFVPDWQSHINAASFIRDARMAEYGTHLLVLSNGISKESLNLIEEARKNRLTIKTIGVFKGLPEHESGYAGAYPGTFY